MPNHCDNDLRIIGKKKDLKRFREFAQEETEGGLELLSASKFIPYPQEFADLDKKAGEYNKNRETCIKALVEKGMSEDEARTKAWNDIPTIKDGFNSGGYEWCCDNWGTKWGLYHIELLEETYRDGTDDKYSELFFTFQTAWSPALPVIKKMIEMFPELEFELRYFEQGAGFNGIYRGDKGKVTDDRSGEYFGDRGG